MKTSNTFVLPSAKAHCHTYKPWHHTAQHCTPPCGPLQLFPVSCTTLHTTMWPPSTVSSLLHSTAVSFSQHFLMFWTNSSITSQKLQSSSSLLWEFQISHDKWFSALQLLYHDTYFTFTHGTPTAHFCPHRCCKVWQPSARCVTQNRAVAVSSTNVRILVPLTPKWRKCWKVIPQPTGQAFF